MKQTNISPKEYENRIEEQKEEKKETRNEEEEQNIHTIQLKRINNGHRFNVWIWRAKAIEKQQPAQQ